MCARLFLIPLLMSSAACDRAPANAPAPEARSGELAAPARASASASAGPSGAAQAGSFKDGQKQGQWERTFSYDWPGTVAAHPGLQAFLAKDRDTLLAAEKAAWARDLAENPSLECSGCGNRSYTMEWKAVADTPRFLSLSGEFSTYTGGAHGMYGLRSLVWDKQARKVLEPTALFRSPDLLEKALAKRLCAALAAEQTRRRGADIGPGGGGIFPDCPSLTEATLLVGSSDKRVLNRVSVYFGPYVAGSYAEGAYELDLDVDGAMLAAVKPEYAEAFAVRRR